MIYTVAAY